MKTNQSSVCFPSASWEQKNFKLSKNCARKIGCHVGLVLWCSTPSFNTCLLSPETTDPCLSRASYSRGFIKVRVFRSTVYLTIPTLFCASAGATGRCDVATPASCQLSSHVSGGCSTRQLRCCNNYPVSTPADYLHSLSSVVTGHKNKNLVMYCASTP